jgi:glutaryl-CoA dehydrogenase
MDDLFLIQEELTDEERQIQASIIRYLDEHLLKKLPEYFEQAIFPKHFIQDAADLGLLGSFLPEEYGGSNSSYRTYGVICEALEWGDSALRSFVSVQSSLGIYPIYQFGTPEQKNRFLKEMIQGKIISCFGLTEPDAGSDPAGMKTHAKKVKGGYILNGSKTWITNAVIADIAIVWAKTDEGVRGFIIEKNFKGFKAQAIHSKMSLRISLSGQLFFEDVFIPDENVLDCKPGLGAAFSCLNQARFGICFGVMGAARFCFEQSLQYLLDRKQFNRPLASFQMIQNDLALMYTEIQKAKCLNLQLAKLKDTDKVKPEMISLAKSNNCREALKIARTCRNLLGGNGISLEYHIIRHMLNLESTFTYEGTDNVHKLILGRYLTGINAFE